MRCGVQRAGIAGLEHGAIDRAAGVITFVGKRRKLRAIPLTKAALKILDRQPRHLKSQFVFWHFEEDADGKPVTVRYRNVASNFANYTKKAEARAA